MNKLDNTCCFTGHRNIPANKFDEMVMNLNFAIEMLILRGVTVFISGGALGFDQIAATLVIAKRKSCKKVRLIFALPCKDQDARWNEKQKAAYRNLLAEADEVVYVSENYDAHCMRRRNRYMVDRAAFCICALLYERSGTAQTVRYAHKMEREIIHVI